MTFAGSSQEFTELRFQMNRLLPELKAKMTYFNPSSILNP